MPGVLGDDLGGGSDVTQGNGFRFFTGPKGEAGYLDQVQAHFNPQGYEAYYRGLQNRAKDAAMRDAMSGGAPNANIQSLAMAMDPQFFAARQGYNLPQPTELMQVQGLEGPAFYAKQQLGGGKLGLQEQPVGGVSGPQKAGGPEVPSVQGAAGQPTNIAKGGIGQITQDIQRMKGEGKGTEEILQELQKIHPSLAAMLAAIVHGQEIPTHLSMRHDLRDAAIQLAPMIDPTYQAGVGLGRIQGFKDWTSGKSAESLRALNQGLNHIANGLLPASQDLPGHVVPKLNQAENFVRTNILGQPYEQNFTGMAHAVADEVGKIWKGNNLSDTEIRKWEEGLSPNMSQEQIRGAIQRLRTLIHGGIEELENKRNTSLGPAGSKRVPVLSPTGETALKRIDQFLGGGTASTPPAAPGATPPKGVVPYTEYFK